MTYYTTVVLNQSVFSEDPESLGLLNEIVAHHETLSPGLLMSSTGCSLRDSFYILILLFERHLAEGYLVIYHLINPDRAIFRRPLSSGLPKTPFIYDSDDGEVTVNDIEDIFYTIEFDLLKDTRFEFVVTSNE